RTVARSGCLRPTRRCGGEWRGAARAKVPNEDALDDDLMAIFVAHMCSLARRHTHFSSTGHRIGSVPLPVLLFVSSSPRPNPAHPLWYQFSRSLYAAVTTSSFAAWECPLTHWRRLPAPSQRPPR